MLLKAHLLLCILSCSITIQPAGAQPSVKLPRVVMVNGGNEEVTRPFRDSFLDGMREAGQIDGRTYVMQMRYGGGNPARTEVLIREAVAEAPDVLVVTGLTAARNARNATSTIPVVITTSSDLVDAGIVASLARPGGNVTGVSDLADETSVKRLELLKAAMPKASRVALLNNPDFPATPKIEAKVEGAAASLGVAITRLHATDRASLLAAIDNLARARPDAILIGGDAVFVNHSRELIEHASALRVPVVHYWPGTAEQGALISHQADIRDNFHRAAGYVDRILKGAKPGDLSIHQPTRYALVVNERVARELGIVLPQAFLLRADQVIQ